MAEAPRYIEASPEPDDRRAFHPNRGLGNEHQEFFKGDEVFLKSGTQRGTVVYTVEATTEHNGKWFLRLSEGAAVYDNGAWVSQKRVSLARKGPNRP